MTSLLLLSAIINSTLYIACPGNVDYGYACLIYEEALTKVNNCSWKLMNVTRNPDICAFTIDFEKHDFFYYKLKLNSKTVIETEWEKVLINCSLLYDYNILICEGSLGGILFIFYLYVFYYLKKTNVI